MPSAVASASACRGPVCDYCGAVHGASPDDKSEGAICGSRRVPPAAIAHEADDSRKACVHAPLLSSARVSLHRPNGLTHYGWSWGRRYNIVEHAAVRGPSLIDAGVADSVFTAKVRYRNTGLVLPQDRYNLFFAKSTALCSLVLLWGRSEL